MDFTAGQEKLLRKAQGAYVRSEINLRDWLEAVADIREAGISPSEAAPYIGVSVRALYNVIKINDYIAKAKVPAGDIDKLGITRLFLLAHQTQPEDYRAWRKEALSMTRRQLERHVRGKTSPATTVVFVLAERDRSMLISCLQELGASMVSNEGGRKVLRGKDQALVRLVREWRKHRPQAA